MAESSNVPLRKLRYAGTCGCGRRLPAGTRAGYDRITKAVICQMCLDTRGLSPSKEAAPTSLERTYRQRKAARGQRVTSRFPRLGRLLLAVTPEPATTKAFKTGAEGEAMAAERILGRAGDNALFLHNRRLGPGRRDGDIDLIAVTPAGVLVIDVKHYRKAKVEVRSHAGLLSERTQELYVAGRCKSSWLPPLERQRQAVRQALDSAGRTDVPVFVVLCFVDGQLPLLERLSIGDIAIYGSRKLGRRIRDTRGPWGPEARTQLRHVLDSALPPA